MKAKLGILVSGRGSNMVALLAEMRAGTIPAEPALVVSHRANAPAVERARSFGVPTTVIEAPKGIEPEAHDRQVEQALEAAGVQWICLAGYMRILSNRFVTKYQGRLLNIHPSLLPAFPGLHPQRQALAAGVRISGCTVHFVVPAVDQGPIIAQAAVPVLTGDDEARLAARILEQEHRIYPLATAAVLSGEVRLVGDRVLGPTEPHAAPSSLVAL